MPNNRARPDDLLFLSALAAVLAGTGLLLKTTGYLRFGEYLWPLIVIAAGGFLLYLSVVRKLSDMLFAVGLFLAQAGILMIVAVLASWRLVIYWPLHVTAAGFSWLAMGIRRPGRPSAAQWVPAASFIALGLFFALFSFDIIPVSLGRFIAIWWPSVLIAGGIALFVAYGAKHRRRRGRGRSAAP